MKSVDEGVVLEVAALTEANAKLARELSEARAALEKAEGERDEARRLAHKHMMEAESANSRGWD